MIRLRGGAAVQDLLVERARRGDRDAFSALAARVVDGCYSLAYAVLRDADLARDAVQAALLGAWRDLPDLREVEKFDAWLHRLVVHACYAEARRERRWTAAVRAFPTEHPTLPDTAISVADRDELERAFRRLPPEQRAVVALRYYLDLPLSEVAATLGIPPGTARSRLHHATRQLRAAVEADARPAVTSEGRLP
jgi:RNA polymerase sigma-70 factor (ECF subfamily)